MEIHGNLWKTQMLRNVTVRQERQASPPRADKTLKRRVVKLGVFLAAWRLYNGLLHEGAHVSICNIYVEHVFINKCKKDYGNKYAEEKTE